MILLMFIFLFVLIYIYTTRNHGYWFKRNVKHDRPLPLFGNHLRNVIGFKSITELAVEMYNKYPDEKIVGYYRGNTPEFIVRDLDLARSILSADFAHFYPRGLGRNPDYEPLMRNVFHADGDSWKLLRKRLTPAFTTAKLKAMFPLVVRCAEKLQDAAEAATVKNGKCDARELMARFTTEFIGVCGFGIETDSINDEHSRFRQFGKKVFTRSWLHFIVIAMWELFPELRNFIYFPDRGLEITITQIFEGVYNQRNGKPSGRNDFIDLLLELQQKGIIQGESVEKINPDGTPVKVEMEMNTKCMIAQMFVFFAAGFETSSSATSYTLHELAFNPDIQSKIQTEIDEVLMKYNNKLCYDAIAEMSLLSMSFKEAMRIFPSLGCLHRVCATHYTLPGTNVTIDPGVKVIIPLQAIQNDSKYFDNPTKFNPERFVEGEEERHKYSYMPFGDGPRACIGARLGEMQSLAGLAALLHKFTVEPAENTLRKPEIQHTSNLVQAIKDGLPLTLKLRNRIK